MEQTNVASEDFIVSALLSELKAGNDRKDKTIRSLLRIICGCILVIVVIVGCFLWYLNQYDYSSVETTTTNATGVYTLIDSSGNVIAQDLPLEEIQEILDGTDNSNYNTDETPD